MRPVFLVNTPEGRRLHQELVFRQLQAVDLRHGSEPEITESVQRDIFPQLVPAFAAAS